MGGMKSLLQSTSSSCKPAGGLIEIALVIATIVKAITMVIMTITIIVAMVMVRVRHGTGRAVAGSVVRTVDLGDSSKAMDLISRRSQ